MLAIKVDLPRSLQYAEIHTLSDLHLGDRYCNYKELLDRVKEIEQNPNAYVILNGDLINNATTQSVSDTYAETISPMEQLKQAKALFEPIKHKILAITSGNHEARTYRADGIDLTEILARELGLVDRYAPESVTIFLRLGQMANGTKIAGKNARRQVCYMIFATHGSGGGRREGGKINRLVDLASIVDVDIYIHSHTHLPAILKQGYFRADAKNSTVAAVDKLFVNTNAWLKYGGYGEAQGYKPASNKAPVIYLSGSRKEFTAKL